MKTTTAPVLLLPAPRDPADIMHDAHIITHQICANRYKLTGQHIMLEMDNANRRDVTAEQLPAWSIEEEALRLLHDSLMEEYREYKAIAQRVTATQEEREAAAAHAAQLKARATQAKLQADAIWERIQHSTMSAAADMTQAAALELWFNGNWQAAQKAAGRESNALRKAAGCAGRVTELTPITEAEYRAKCKTVTVTKPDGSTETVTMEPEREAVKGTKGRDNGFITYEHRNSPKYKGYFAVWHRPAERAVIVYDTMDADSATASTYADNGGLNAIHDEWDKQHILSMLEAANLSERDRAVVLKAAAIIMQTDAHTPHQYSAAWARALRLCNVYGSSNQHDTKQHIEAALSSSERSRITRIKDKLKAAKTAQDAADAEWERINAHQTPAAPDLIAGQSHAAANQPTAAPVIRWTRRPYAVNMTDAEAEASRAAEAAAVAAYDRRRDALAAWDAYRAAAHQADTWTAGGYYSAAAAAAALLDREAVAMTVEDVQTWYAAHKADRAAQNAARAALAQEQAAARKAAEAAARAAEDARRAAFLANMQRWEQAQAERKAAEDAAARAAAELAARRREAYNAAIRAAYARMHTTHPKASEQQRAKARAAAERAAAKVK